MRAGWSIGRFYENIYRPIRYAKLKWNRREIYIGRGGKAQITDQNKDDGDGKYHGIHVGSRVREIRSRRGRRGGQKIHQNQTNKAHRRNR